MKQKIYSDSFSPEPAKTYTNYVDSIEREVIKYAHGVIAVTEIDAGYISELAPKTTVYIVPIW